MTLLMTAARLTVALMIVACTLQQNRLKHSASPRFVGLVTDLRMTVLQGFVTYIPSWKEFHQILSQGNDRAEATSYGTA